MSVIISSDMEAAPSRNIKVPGIHWGAVFAGVVVGLAVQLVLALLGVANGLSAIQIADGNPGISNVGKWAVVWQGFSMLVAAFIGGYVAARMSGLLRKSDGLLHGFVSWGATTLLFAVLSMTAAGAFFGSVFHNAGGLVSSAVAGTTGTAAGQPTDSLSALIQRAGGPNVLGGLTADDMTQLQSMIAAGNRDQAINYLTQITTLSRSQAAGIVDQALIVSGSPQQASPQARATADRAVQSANAISWALFAAVILSLALGLGGGTLGAIRSRRIPRVHVA